MSKLSLQAWLGLACVVIAMALLLVVPAGTLHYWQAWLYLAMFFGLSVLTTIYLMKHDPALLQRRLRGGPTAEKEPTQRIIMVLASIGFIGLLVVSALDYRFKWSGVPLPAIVAGDLLTVLGFGLIFLVYRENSFTSATIEVASNQHVVSTGPYAVVRHPMYAGALLYLLRLPSGRTGACSSCSSWSQRCFGGYPMKSGFLRSIWWATQSIGRRSAGG